MPLALAAPPQIKTVTTADDGWYRQITSFAQHTVWLQSPMKLYTLAGIGLLGLMALYAWWSARARADRAAMVAVAWLGLGTVISVACGLGLKQVFQENRPCQAIHVTTVQACPGPSDYSFPSDHTTVAVALAVGLWIVSRKLGIIAAILAVIEGFSRVYLGQHYPHDVLGGAILSTAVLLIGWPLARRPLTSLVTVLEATPLRPLLTSAPAGAAPSAPHAADRNGAPNSSGAPYPDENGSASYGDGAHAERAPAAGPAPVAQRGTGGPSTR
jgi:membrane-associated phospholipid phosphatase